MRRAKIGDVYCIKVPNGYKLFKWAYNVPRKGNFIRVFNGLYDSIPKNIEEIISAPHSYIISFYVSRAYRIGLSIFLGNCKVPSDYPFPKYQISFDINWSIQKVEGIHVMNSDGDRDVWKWYYVSSMKELPEEYQKTTLLNGVITPNWLLYLFDNGFDLEHIERYHPGPNTELSLQKYTDIINKFETGQGDGLREP